MIISWSVIYLNKFLQVVFLLCTHYYAGMLKWVWFQTTQAPMKLCNMKKKALLGEKLNQGQEEP